MHMVFWCNCITFGFAITLHATTEQRTDMKIVIFYDEILCTLIDHYQCSGGNCCDSSNLKINSSRSF